MYIPTPAPPSPPTDLTGESISNCGVALSWLPPPQVADGLTLSAEYYVIEARPEDGEWTVVAERVNDTNVMVSVTLSLSLSHAVQNTCIYISTYSVDLANVY